jgi:hypothetical protein
LYRTIHRREDFYFAKDHLPSCFLNLHYKENLFFSSLTDPGQRSAAVHEIERDFIRYQRNIIALKSYYYYYYY